MADPMTQSHQISSSQGLNDGHCKDSKCSDSFFSSSPVSLIQSPQDKRVAPDSDKPSEGVATSLRFSSQPSSFSPVTYGNESSGTSSGIKSRSFQEKLELFESSVASQKQDSSPIKVSPVSERIKALEALAAKKNDSDWSDGGFPHFKERHYEKSPTEGHGIPYRSSVKKKPTPTEQDSPESPFEILGDARRGSDFEDTADWMRTHLPPAPNFNIDEADFDEVKPSSVMPESPCKEAKRDATESPAIPESFVGVPDEFMDTPAEVTSQINDDPIQSKQDSIEDESEFDLRFLPTAYMWDKQEKADMDAQEPPGLSETHEVAAAPAPPAGFESSSLASPTPVAQVDLSVKEQTDTLGGSKEPAETLEVDSSGESDDTVIEEVNGLGGHAAGTDTLECKPSTNKEALPHEQVKPVIQVPIINVIETEEQVFSDYEVEHEEELEEEQDEDDDEQNYQIKRESTREDSQSPEEHSEPLKSMPEEASPATEDISSRAILIGSDSPEGKLIEDNASEHTFTETSLERPGSEDLQAQSAVSLNAAETFSEYAVNAVETDETAEIISDLPPNYDELSNEAESSDIDTYLDHYTNEELALHDQLNSDVFTETDSEAGELLLCDSHQNDQNSTIFAQQSYEETVDEVDESLQESKMSYNALPETSPTVVSADASMEHLLSQNQLESLETEEQIVVVEDQKAIAASSNYSLMEEEDHVTQPAAILSSVQESTPAPFPSFHNDLSSDLTEEVTDFDVTKGIVETSSEQGEAVQCDASERKESPQLISKPETTETEPPVAEATDSFVEFMRECLKLQQDDESKSPGQTRKEPISVTPSPPVIVMDLVEEENLTISALTELESRKEEDDETNICNKNVSMSSKDEASQQKSESIGSLPTAQCLPNEYQSDASLTREVEAIDIWVGEAYHLAEHVLAVILTHLSVQDLVYWRDPKKSGIVFGTSLLLLLSLAAFSVISVVSYLLLALLCVTISFRVYKSVMQAVQKTNEGHPFKELMEKDVSLPPETFRKNVDVCLTYINRGLKQLSRLFLVEDLVDSLKLAVVMWLLTYVGAVFNGITVLILADILAFTVPPLYEKYKTQIDHYVGIARTHLKNVVTKIQEKLPKSAKRNKTE